MCLTQRKEVEITRADAFKIFTRDKEGLLQSVFASTFKGGLKYPSNERIRVDVEEANFFALEGFKEAVSIAREGRRKWNMVRGDLIVLPVTLFEVVATGKYHVPSGDPQCLDGYYPAFEAKEIQVNDTQETRDQFYTAVVVQYFNKTKYSMSAIDKEALIHHMPHMAGSL